MSRKKILLLSSLMVILILFFQFDLPTAFTLDALNAKKSLWLLQYNQNKLLFILGYSVVYILSTALSIPGAVVLSLAGGWLFGSVWGTVIVNISATLGATLAFLIARYLFRDSLEARFSKQLHMVNGGVNKNAFQYVLFLRFIPAFPFFLVNLLCGLTRLPLSVFLLGSAIGMLPGTFVYVHAGQELSKIERLPDIVSADVLLALCLLGALSLAPILYKRWRKGQLT